MSSANPPYPFYNGIPFNPSFFTSDTGTGSGLTETAANALYLRKTTPDAATALETFNGGVNVVGTTNINSTLGGTTTIGGTLTTTNMYGTVKTDMLNATTSTSNQTIGSNLQSTGTLTLSATTAAQTTINGGIIKNIIPCLGGGNIETVIGNANNMLSLSTTFNRKFTSSLVAIPCYAIVSPGNYSTQYFEIVISGANNNRGGYTFKGSFGLQTGTGVTASAITQVFFYGSGVAPVITFSIVSLTTTLSINTSTGSSDQCFVSTLTSYPSLQLDNGSSDYSITAI